MYERLIKRCACFRSLEAVDKFIKDHIYNQSEYSDLIEQQRKKISESKVVKRNAYKAVVDLGLPNIYVEKLMDTLVELSYLTKTQYNRYWGINN